MPRPHIEFVQQQSGVLRPDTPIGERTWLLRLDIEEPCEIRGVERHPCGPTGSKSGFTALFRAKEGAFETDWSDLGAPVPWDSPYNPVLPSSEAP